MPSKQRPRCKQIRKEREAPLADTFGAEVHTDLWRGLLLFPVWAGGPTMSYVYRRLLPLLQS